MTARIALVTGANRGIGFETCRALGKLGYRVVLTARDPALGRQVAAGLASEGLDVRFRQLDVTDAASISRIKRLVDAEYRRLDVLVNNAAVYLDGDRNVFQITPKVLDSTLNVNVQGPWLLCRAFIPLMQKQGYGRIVNVSSEYGSLSSMTGDSPSYRISKAALNALTRVVADTVDGCKIKVNAVCPGWVRTRMGGPGAELEPHEAVDTIVRGLLR